MSQNETRPVCGEAGSDDLVGAPVYVAVYRSCTPVECGIRSSVFHRCNVCRGQLNPDQYAARMELFAQSARNFSEQQLGRPYVEFKGVGQ